MDKNVASSLEQDVDGKALMSLEELKEGMFQTIRDNGTVELIRAQLRRRFIEKLQQCRSNGEQDEENHSSRANQNAISSTPNEKLVHGLVTEYLATKGLENTLAVFVPEIGGARNQVDSATILEMLHVSSDVHHQLEMKRVNTGQSLLLVLVQELVRRSHIATMECATQTAMDCFDHRIVLENQLRRVENSYLTECAAQKLEPQQSLEERMVQYQREYDAICDKRLQEKLEQCRSTEVALVRAEERKRFDREVDNLRASLLQEYHNKQERLQEREREFELAFVARRTELETSLFETRQSLFKDMERLRVKEAELQVKVESDFRHFSSETQRFQLWEESVRTQEANLESIVAQAMREKERAWNIERQQALREIQLKHDELADREQTLTTETGTLKMLKTQVTALQQEVAALEAALSKSEDDLRLARGSTLQLDKDRQRLEEQVAILELQLSDQKNSLIEANAANSHLEASNSFAQNELLRHKQKNADVKTQMKSITAEVKLLQQQMLDMKLNEANSVVAERKKLMLTMDEERERFQWKENELLAKIREIQSRLAESETIAEKYQSQYEDEKIHVESLRHDVSSLNSLLTQAQATINAKHSTPSFRGQRSIGNSDAFDGGAHVQGREGFERTFMMKMMEMMTNFQGASALQRDDSRRDCTNTHETERDSPGRQDWNVQTAETLPTLLRRDEDQEEAKRLKDDQARIESTIVEQREYEKAKKARMEEHERELAEQNRQFEEQRARMRKEIVEEEEKIEEQRKIKRAEEEEETRLLEELARQRAAVQEAADFQQKIIEQRLVDEQARRAEQLAEEEKVNKEMELKQQQQLEDEAAARKRNEEAEEERLEQELKTHEEQKQKQLEIEEEAAIREAKKSHEEVDRLHDEQLRLAEEEKQRKLFEVAEPTRIEAEIGKESRQQSDDAESSSEDTKADTVINHDDTVAAVLESNISGGNLLQDATEGVGMTQVTTEDANDPVPDESNEIDSAVAKSSAKSPEEEEQERAKAAEEAKKKEDEDAIDVYRQRVLARKAAEKQRQQEQEAEKTRKAQEEEERQRLELLGDVSESDHELELSGGSFAESSVASNSDSF